MPSGDTPDLNLLFPQRAAAPEQKLFGRYTLKRVLGRGGMGIVWMAHDDELHRHVAMKFLPDMLIRDREAVNDLKRETRRSLDLTHHHIVRIYDFTQDDVCAAIIMEYVDGETLSAMKTQQPGGCFSVSTIAAWVAHFCQALDYAHRQARVVHRDLKPANLMVNSRGDLKVTDFGISRSMSDSMTRVSMSNTAGTLAYMSPEQALGAPPAACDDVYAFGATIYDLLTGRPPFFRGNIQVQLETVIPPKMAERREELGNQGELIPDLWEEVIAACLAKRPHDRPQGMSEIAAMLGLAAPSSSLRTTFSPGVGTAAGTGGPGTASTRIRTSSTEDAATRTDTVPPAPQTTRPATAPTPGTAYVSTPRPTALRDVIPGYIDEPAAPSADEAFKRATPATTPTQPKADEEAPVPPPPTAPAVTAPEPEIDPVVAELSPPIEPAAEPVSEPVADELPPDISLEVAAAEPESVAAASTPMAEEAVAIPEVEAPVEAPPVLDQPVVESERVEPELAVGANEPAPIESASAVEEDHHLDFPTVIGEPLVLPERAEPDEAPAQKGDEELPAAATATPFIATPEPAVELVAEEAQETIVEEISEPVLPAPVVDEAAATMVDVSLPEPVQPVPVAPVAPPMESVVPGIIRSPTTAVEEPVSSPARGRSRPWLPIAAVAGVAVVIAILLAMPKGEDQRDQPNLNLSTPRAAEPTPLPIVNEDEVKLQRARELFANQEFAEAIALLKGLQQRDPDNAAVTNLLAEIQNVQQQQEMMAAKAKRDQQIAELFNQADAAMDREQWPEMRAALEKVIQLDPQNPTAAGRLANLKDAQDEWVRAEQQRQQELAAEKQRQLAAMQAEQQRQQLLLQQQQQQQKKNTEERPRSTAREEEPVRKPKATPRPQRAQSEDESNDRPPRRTVVNREDDRPPAPARPQVKARPTPAPAPAQPQRRQNVFRGGAPGG